MLAEQSAVLGWEVPAGTSVHSVACETAAEVDDISLTLSSGDDVLMQAKLKVTAYTGPRSPLAKTADEFVRQHLVDGGRTSPLVLVCGPRSSAAITEGVPSMLRRLRDDPPPDANDVTATNGHERSGWTALLSVITRSWVSHTGAPPSAAQLVALLSRVHVDVLDVEDGGRDEQRALDRLADVVLVNPARAAGVWQILVERMLSIAAGQRGIVRTRLQALLIAEGVELAVVRSLRRDVETLRSHTATTARRLDRHRALRLGTELVELRRDVQAPLRAAAMAGSMLLVGPPGNGKSGLLAEFIYELLDDGVDLVALRAEDLAARTADELRRELGLEHPLSEVLAGWPGGPGLLIIDGLDAARGADASHTLITLIEDQVATGSRWRVLASVRSFDLRYNKRLRAVMPTGRAAGPNDPEFADVNHLAVPALSDGELARLETAAPQLHALVERASPELRALVCNSYNLSLLAELTSLLPAERLTGIVTQLELLRLYWNTVAATPADERTARERTARALCTAAGERLALQVSRDDVLVGTGDDDTGVLALLRAGVLVEHLPLSAFGPPRLAFAHNILFDYAFGRLALAQESAELSEQLREAPDLLFVARPSLVLRLEELWTRPDGTDAFWDCALRLADPSQGIVTQLVAPAVAATHLNMIGQLAPLLHRLDAADEDERMAAGRLLHEVVAARMAAGPADRPLSTATPGTLQAWAQLAATLADRAGSESAAAWLLWALWREAAS